MLCQAEENLSLLLLLCMPSLLPSVAAAAGEILGELRQRFMSSLPAGGRACEAETGKSHNGQGS